MSVKPAARVEPPKQLSANPVVRVLDDVWAEARVRRHGTYPPGPQEFSFGRTLQAARDPLPLLLSLYEEHGPIFSVRLLHSPVIFMLGPEANHFVTVAHPENFHWRESSFGDLIPLLGDGLLTVDDDYHDRARAIMLPAFHREQLGASVAAMEGEAAAAIAASAEVASETSQTTATPPISEATASASLALRSQTATFAPCAASRRAVAAPNPDAPPVTIVLIRAVRSARRARHRAGLRGVCAGRGRAEDSGRL